MAVVIGRKGGGGGGGGAPTGAAGGELGGTFPDPSIMPLGGVYQPQGWDDSWQAALAASGSTPAIMAVLGDSVSRGYFASLLDTLGYAGRIGTSLQGTYGDGGHGFISAGADLGSINAVPAGFAAQMKVAKTGFAAASLTSGPGLGGNVCSTTNADTLTFTSVRGTIIDIWYLTGGSLGTFTYNIDGTGAVSQATAGANGTGKVTISGLVAGNHTVVLTVTSAASGVFINGVTGRNTTGVRVDNYSMQGAASITGNATWGLTALWSGGPSNRADLMVISLGLNNEVSNTTGDAYIAALNLNLEQIRSTNAAISVLLLLNLAGPTWSANDKMMDYATRLPAFANHWNCGLMDVGGRFNGSWQRAKDLNYWSTGSGSSGGAGSDQAHPGNVGHLTLANQIIPILTGSLPGAPS